MPICYNKVKYKRSLKLKENAYEKKTAQTNAEIQAPEQQGKGQPRPAHLRKFANRKLH